MQILNAKLPTLGGRQFWADQFIHSGWRIQENIRTNIFRLLDPNDFLISKGQWQNCKDIFDHHASLGNLHWDNEHLVILVHGLCRTKGAFHRMHQMISDQGLAVQAINYPSTQFNVSTFAKQLNNVIARLRGIRKVSFVTHSLGGVIVRTALSEKHPWMDWLDVGDIIQIAPPNKGATIAKTFENLEPFKWGVGPVGLELANGFNIQAPSCVTNFHVIAGGTGKKAGYNPFLGSDNDGLVTTDETDLPFSHNAYRLKAPHTLLINHDQTFPIVKNILK